MRFSNYFFLESKIRDVPESVVQQANKIADSYLSAKKNLTNSQLKKLKKEGLGEGWEEYFKERKRVVDFVLSLDDIEFEDLKINTIVTYKTFAAFGEGNDVYAECDTNDEFIIIYDDACRGLPRDKLISTIIHEIIHGLQQHKTYSSKYKKAVAKKYKNADSLYHKEPIEFDAFTAEISYIIQNKYQKMKNDILHAEFPETKKFLERKLEKFLMELKVFVNAPLDTYFIHDELPLPTSMHTFESMLKSIQEDPSLWKKFKSKMLNLVSKLT